ncbi:Gpi1-domain-containing protein [Westerdykella ornata]|uniref:Gpi1-domain-containing protein n=1 Tax=Westerdykella ornata TaxID=318751 RepID=A0A6A6JNV4_WESOR|nr:Gpi1-domain-containing protein [Westerdykella ornata]KAF2278301.1 Gpi1-domain-containing protein [Westerdykella ornata]
MVTSNGLMRVFWPSGAADGSSAGVLVGFRNSELDIFVVSILQDVELRSVENALAVGLLFRKSPFNIQELLRRCGHSSMRVLGVVNPKVVPDLLDSGLVVTYTDARDNLPRLRVPSDSALTIQVILYDRPHPTQMQYLSLRPMSLALDDKAESRSWDPISERTEEEEAKARQKQEKLVEKLKLHTVIARPSTQKERALPMVIDQINCSFELDELLQKNVPLIGRRSKRALSVSERVVESANHVWGYTYRFLCYIGRVWIYPVLTELFILALMALRLAAELVLRLLHWRPRLVEFPALKDMSATAQQIDIRLQQFCYWPIQYLTLRRRKANWGSITTSHPEYIRFYNSLWLVANDIIIGIALGSFLFENAAFVASKVDTVFTTWSIEGLRRMISWLMGWPGGLKLNNELAEFLGDLFLWVIDCWAGCITFFRPHLPLLIRCIGFSAFTGATMPISLCSDLVSLLTVHIYAFYATSARLYYWQLTIIISLFHLFRGKKRNVLRNRIDSCDYELDQLLLGTILFTLLVFLLPTVFVFYLLFASARVAAISLKVGLEVGLACLNHFPLFAVMLRVKDSRRLPGGIYFELRKESTETLAVQRGAQAVATSYVLLRSIPLPLRDMFHSYFEVGHRIRKHYLLPGVILRLVRGQFVPPLPRRNLYSLQYSMLPAKRVSMSELWARLKDREPKLGAPVADGHGYPKLRTRRTIVSNGPVRKGSW